MMASHKENDWEWNCKKFKVIPGQFVTSLDSIVTRCGSGITTQNVRTALKRFEKLDFLTNESTKQGRLITIVNWRTYQVENDTPNKEGNKELTNDQQRANKELTPINNVITKQCNNLNNICAQNDQIIPNEDAETGKSKGADYPTEFLNFWNQYPKKKDKARAYRCWRTRIKEKHLAEEMIAAAKNYAKVNEGTDERYIKNASTFLGPDKPFLEYVLGSDVFENSNIGKHGDNGRDRKGKTGTRAGSKRETDWNNEPDGL